MTVQNLGQHVLILTLAATACLTLTIAPAQAAMVLRLEADNYDAGTGIWTDTSGLNNHATQGTPADRPALVTGQTASGSSIVRFDGGDSLDLTSGISTTSGAAGYTAFAYVRPEDTGGAKSIFSGVVGSFQYRINASEQQQVVRSFQLNLGSGLQGLPTGTSAPFSLISSQINNAGGLLRFGGGVEGGLIASSFTNPITSIGRNDQSDGELFLGDIAEIRIYNTQLLVSEIEAIEAALESAYGASASAIPEPSSALLMLWGVVMTRRMFRRRASAAA